MCVSSSEREENNLDSSKRLLSLVPTQKEGGDRWKILGKKEKEKERKNENPPSSLDSAVVKNC